MQKKYDNSFSNAFGDVEIDLDEKQDLSLKPDEKDSKSLDEGNYGGI